MKYFISTFPIIILLASAHVFGQGKIGGWDPEKEKKEMAAVDTALQNFKEKDPSMQKFFDKAYGYVIFPSIGKGAFLVGGAHGNGKVFEGGKVIGNAELTQATVGLQMGGQSYSEIIFFEDEKAMNAFKANKLAFSAQVSAIVADAGASADVAYNKGVAVFTLPKGGLMYEASVGGQKFKFKPLTEK